MKKIGVIALCFLVASCGSTKEQRKRPSIVLPADSMSELLAELHIINARHQHRDIRKEKLQAYVIQDFQGVYDSLGVSKERFDTSFAWWSEDTDAMQEVLDKSLNILNTRVSQIKTEKRLKSAKRDTLKIDSGKVDVD